MSGKHEGLDQRGKKEVQCSLCRRVTSIFQTNHVGGEEREKQKVLPCSKKDTPYFSTVRKGNSHKKPLSILPIQLHTRFDRQRTEKSQRQTL